VVNTQTSFGALRTGTALGPLRLRMSAAANARYWQAAGLDHALLRAGALYPPVAANLTVLVFGEHCPDAVIQTRQRLRCHRIASAETDLVTTAEITATYEKRGRAYCDVLATITTSDAPNDPLWTSEVSFTPAATLTAGA
jgi:hypothetical protein